MTRRSRHQPKPRRRFVQKLSAYAATGGALVAADASAGIVHTDLGPAGVRVTDGSFPVDLNHDGLVDFELISEVTPGNSTSTTTFAAVFVRGPKIIRRSFHWASQFDMSELIDPVRATGTFAPLVGFNDNANESFGPFACDEPYCNSGKRGFLGLAFQLDGQHAAWIDVHATGFRFTAYGFAYETEAGLPILAGDTGISPNLPGDTNGDGTVDLEDLNNVRNNFGASGDGIMGDTNDDDLVDLEDLNAVRNNFGAGNPVPEPPSLVLLAAGAAALGVWRRKRLAQRGA